MKLVMLYGPPAAGKLTVARELAKLTGLKLLDNHVVFNALTPLFPFEDPKLNPIRARLGRALRLELYEEAAKADVSFISTIVLALPDTFKLLQEAREVIARHNGQILFVQLNPSLDALLVRVNAPSRHGVKLTDKERLKLGLEAYPSQRSKLDIGEHLSIDNTNLAPAQVAEQIAAYYKLQGR